MVELTATLNAASFTANFDDGKVPASTRVYGNATVENSGGMGGSGALKLTKAANDRIGSFVINELDNGAAVYGFRVSLMARVGGGTSPPADGWSFCFATDLPNAPWGEEGAGNGLIIAFDTFNNGGGEAPAIEVKVGGQTVAYKYVSIADLLTGANFVPVRIDLDSNGSLYVDYGGKALFATIPFPGPQGIAHGRFGFGARTGGLNSNHFIDDLSVETILTPARGTPPMPAAQSAQVSLTPYSCCDGEIQLATVGGERVWQTVPGNDYMYFNVPNSFPLTPGSPVYVRVDYFDAGGGTIALQYDSSRGSAISDLYARSETHTRSARVNSGQFVSSYHELQRPKFAGRQNGGSDFRLNIYAAGSVALSVKSVVIQSKPFDDATFQYVLTKPWLVPYSGPTRSYVGNDTLRHKTMVGYQGWFRTPNDLSDQGWRHWCRDDQMVPTNFSVDLWPDLSGFSSNEIFRAGEVLTTSGKPAYVFSSTTRETVRRHFQWMRKYDIDGVFLQRFVHPNSSGAWGSDEWVLHHVREAANQEGRIWAIEYDVSSLNPSSPGNGGLDPYEVMQTDWKWLVDTVGVLRDPQYAHEGNKPVVFIWGLPFPDRGFDKSVANRIVDFFKNDPLYGGNYVIGGIPWWWRTMPDWFDHFQRYDGALAWMPEDQAGFAADFQMLKSWGIDYFPHAWPGFSWANLQRQPAATSFYAARNGGEFFWNRINQALGSGAERLFIGMFDEYDEGTAIMPMSDDPPQPPTEWGRFVTNEGKPSDWWMMLAGEAREMLLRHRPLGNPLPTEAELANRAETGPEASVDLGTENRESFLRQIETDGGKTSAATVAGRDCRFNTDPAVNRFFYFDVDSAFAHGVAQGLDVTLEVEYYDGAGSAEVSLQYDGVNDAYSPHPKKITTQSTGEWRTVRYNIADAFFGNRQTGGSDFRIEVSNGAGIFINRLWLAKSQNAMPLVIVQPQDQSAREGDSVTLSVAAMGTEPLSYQWWFNGSPLSAATNAALILENVTPNQAGNYSVRVITPTGSITSQTAVVTVIAAPRLVWNSPADITYGTPLSAAQLDATANVSGTFRYDPPLHTVLFAGNGQILSVTFSPTDANGFGPITRTVTLNVLRAALTISADDKARPFGQNNPVLTATYTGFVNGDGPATLSAQPTLATPAARESAVGAYPILVGGAASPNYEIQYVEGMLTVMQTDQTINFDVISPKIFGDTPFTVNATATSGLPVRFSILSGPAMIEGNRITLTGAGTVTIRAGEAGDANYLPAPDVQQTFEVAKAHQSISFDPISNKALGVAPFTLRATATSGLPILFSVLTGPAAIQGNSVTLLNVGAVVVRASQAGDANYDPAAPADQSFSVLDPISAARFLANGQFAFTFTGEPGITYELEASGDLEAWIKLDAQLNTTGSLEFIDPTAATFQRRFYRVRPHP